MEQADSPKGKPAMAESDKVPKPESRIGRFLRRSLRWAAGIVVVFALGVAATWVTQVRPRVEQLDALNAELAALEQQRAQLEAEVEALKEVRSENQTLRAELQRAEGKLALLRVLVDVTTAQLGLAEEDPLAARAALEDTAAALTELGDKLGPSQATTVAGLLERLELVLQELQTDRFAAQRDLEILANTLLEIERQEFGP